VVRRWGVLHHELRLQIQLAELERRVGDRRRAMVHADRALDLCQQLDDPSREARLRYVLGELSLEDGDGEAAAAHLVRGVACARASADGPAEAYCQLCLAECAARNGAHADAVGHLERGQALLQAQGLPRLIGEGWCRRGRVELLLGDPAGARRSLAEAEAVCASLADSSRGTLARQIAELARRSHPPSDR
jgi:tetratricopeptide (TPR) repeat protein